MRRWTLALLAVTAACAGTGAPALTVPTGAAAPVATTTTEPPRDCSPAGGAAGPLDPADPVGSAVALSAATWPCAAEVTLAPAGDPAATAGALANAVAGGGPLLLVEGAVRGDLAAEIGRLAPEWITLVGLDSLDTAPLSGFDLRRLAPAPPPADPPPADPGRIWVVHASAEALLAPIRAAAAAARDVVVETAVDDLRLLDGTAAETIRRSDAPVEVVGLEDAGWQIEVVRRGDELPGGGLVLFPGRRFVALYGNPTTPALGVLGEQGAEAGVERLAPLVEAYGADGVLTLPAFEIIVTVASSRAGADGDYSDEMSVESLRPWVETAARLGAYVVLDLQPGRTDYLTQARRYEELLRLPHVGLALDPEWRLGPNQVHLRQIGSVDAAEVNTVLEWLAGIVREEALPQKLVVLHQFQLRMITNREQVITPEELAVVVQMDGQGPLSTKYDTYAAITAGALDAGWWWGWKNFYDEDSPMATPEQVLALDPLPVFVSFQ